MCGIVGYATSVPNTTHEKVFTQMLYVDALRGWDSTGIASLRKNQERPMVIKKALPAGDFLRTKTWKHFTRGPAPRMMLGHNRAATKGSVVDTNAHPFQVDNITMVHNGSLWFHDNLKDGNKFDVDSHAIANHLAHHSPKDTAESLCGAFALVWYNAEDGKLYMTRNDERPLNVAVAKGERTIYWASEFEMLSYILNRNGVQVDAFYEVEPEKIYTFDLKEDKIGKTFELHDEFTEGNQVSWHNYSTKRSSTKNKWWQSSNNYGANPCLVGDLVDVQVSEITTYTTNQERGMVICLDENEIEHKMYNVLDPNGQFKKGDWIVVRVKRPFANSNESEYKKHCEPPTTGTEIVTYVPGNGNAVVTEKEWEEQTQDGCAWCSQSVTIDQADQIEWLGHRSFLCPDCIGNTDVQEIIN